MTADRARMRGAAVGRLSRTAVAAVHVAVGGLCFLVVVTGRLTMVSFVLWLALCAAGDQAVVWPLWLAGGRRGPNPLRGWNW